MASQRWRYPDNWKEIAFAVKEDANWQCQKCGRLCVKPRESLPDTLKRRAYTLQVHHWNCDPADNRLENLVALCTNCPKRLPSSRSEECFTGSVVL